MFSIDLSDDRFFANCMVNHNMPRIRRFVVDTGAKYTCCSYYYVNPLLNESDFAQEETKFLGGFVANVGMKFYKCKIKQFTVGTVDLGEQDIWITFDDRIADSLLGMDVLKKILYLNEPDNSQLIIYSNNDELYNYISARHVP